MKEINYSIHLTNTKKKKYKKKQPNFTAYHLQDLCSDESAI